MRPGRCKSCPGKGWPPAGTECCADRGRPRLRSVHRGSAGRVMEPREHRGTEPTSLTRRKAAWPALNGPGAGDPSGSKSGACRQGSPRNLGGLVFSTEARRCGRRDRSSPGPGAGLDPGERTEADGGTAERRQRSEGGRKARSRSPLIVLMRPGNPPQGTRGREAVDRVMGLLEG